MLCTHKTTFSASLDYFVTSSPPYLHQFSTISGGNCIKVQEAHQRLTELDALRREYQHTIDVYEDLYNRYQDEHGLNQLYVYAPMRLAELQANLKKKNQLLYSIGQMLREESMTYPTPYPLSSELELFLDRWKLMWCSKFDQITKMPDGEKKRKKQTSSGGLLKQTVIQEYLVMR